MRLPLAVIPAMFLAFAFNAGSALAQQKTLKEQLVGTWTLVSAEIIVPDGTRVPLVKGNPVKGLQIFADSGKYSFQVIGAHAMVASNDRLKMTPDEMKASAESILSNFGTYTVNEAEKSFTVQFESSSFANQTAAPGKRMVEITGDEMRLSNPTRIGGGQTQTVWRRTK